jgi:formylglycine-generating enzyme required for sulfatase activity
LTVATSLLLAHASLAAPAITGVTAQQRYPWNGKVDITYTVSGDIAAAAKAQAAIPSLKVTATDQDSGTTYTATSLSGDTGLADGAHSLVWDMDADGLTPQSTNLAFSVSCKTTQATYCVIDLSAGAEAASYPVTYLAEPPSGGFNVDEYKTTKLVLRRIEAGSFIMGEDQSDTNHRVTLTKPFFIGVFEVTQKQYQLVMGSNPSFFTGDKNPVDSVSYDAIRGSANGANWPSSNAVDSSSFVGKLRARTGLDFDLPTEAQWEYACRASTTTSYSYGNNADGDYMWYVDNASSKTHEVGTKLPNAWGLHDMHGNVWEWCLDWYSDDYAVTGSDVTAPTGPVSSPVNQRVLRGGSFGHNAFHASSGYHKDVGGIPSSSYYTIGFRLCCPVDMRKVEDGSGTDGTPVAAVASLTGFATAAKSESAADGFGTAQDPLDFVSRIEWLVDGLNFDSRKPFGFTLNFR